MSEKLRPPIVVVLGHVDHGKSSILQAIKDLKITEREAGGITQHIGAYEIEEKGKKITFIDTPGHEAFCAMRLRGVCSADVAVLVIAADEGIKKQTKEVIKNIKETNIPFVVAINKIDKPGADVGKIKRQLLESEIYLETMGGKIPFVEVSASTKKGVEHLLEVILLVAEMEEFKADVDCSAQGVVIESHLDSNKGPFATLIVQKGILKKEDFLATESVVGKVKNLEDFQGKLIQEALPSMPVGVLGFEAVPQAGESFKVFRTVEEAREGIKEKEKEEDFVGGDKKLLPLIIRTDVLGSVEAIIHMIDQIPQEKVKARILKAEPGEVDQSDIKTAMLTGAKILSFRTKESKIARDLAQREGVKILKFDVIYELTQAFENVLRKMVEPEIIKTATGRIKILEVFKNEKNRQIVGGKVIHGTVKRGSKVTVLRGEEEIGGGKINALQQNKKEVDFVSKGSECGVLYEGDALIQRGDIIEAYLEEKTKKEL